MNTIQHIIAAFELHTVQDIRQCFENGISANAAVNGRPLVYELINMYTRGPKFRECMQVFVDYGLEFDDRTLLAVLLNNAPMLETALDADPEALHRRYSLNCTFTPLYEASLLHICAEYNHVACAEVLVRSGLHVNTLAGIDENGFGGHSPIFHTVNQDANKSMDMLRFLLEQQAEVTATVTGLIWGRGYEWETFIPAVNPISYAMMGLLRQFQRREEDIYEVVRLLMKAGYGVDYAPQNIPNKYLGG